MSSYDILYIYEYMWQLDKKYILHYVILQSLYEIVLMYCIQFLSILPLLFVDESIIDYFFILGYLNLQD